MEAMEQPWRVLQILKMTRNFCTKTTITKFTVIPNNLIFSVLRPPTQSFVSFHFAFHNLFLAHVHRTFDNCHGLEIQLEQFSHRKITN